MALAQIGTSVAADAINKLVVAPLIQQIDDVIHLDRNRGVLRAKLESMKFLLQDIYDSFQYQQRTPPESIRHCLESVRDEIGEARSLIDRSYLQQRCVDCIFCKPRISRQIREWISRFDELRRELQTLFSIFANAQQVASSSAQLQPKELLQPQPEWSIVGMDIQSAEAQLQTWLTEASQVRKIGVYGMAGVGKTTLLKFVHNFYKVSDVFDVVIWVTVSQVYEIRVLQRQIATALKLDLPSISDQDTDTLKMMLSASLMKKKFLLMLDDMWHPLDLQQELGVAFGADKGSRVVLSTRSRHLALTEADKSIEVKPLSTEDGWTLFEKVAFRSGPVPEHLKECARKVSDECDGLPLAITVVGAAMRDKAAVVEEWNSCLSMMRSADHSFPDTHPRVDRQLYRRLRWSYDDLATTPNLQSCFLYCAMYAEDEEIPVEKLVSLWIAEGFIKTKDMQLGYRYVKLLIDRGLFQNHSFEKQSNDIIVNKPVNVWKWRSVAVHDVIRDMAIYIAEKEEHYLCRSGQQLQDFPHSEIEAECRRISLRRNEIESLPNDFRLCPKLVTLLLSENKSLSCNVPQSFLSNLTSLKVLDLSRTHIGSVPTSLTQLELLVYLDLSHTAIKELPEALGQLAQLQYLNLWGCERLVSLPSSIGKLKQLQYMDLWDCRKLVLPPQLSQVTSLRRLALDIGLNINSFIIGNWSEMKHLLLSLETKTDLPQDIQNMKELQSFWLNRYGGLNLPNSIDKLHQLERLELWQCSEVEELPSLERLPNLKFLKLFECNKVKNLGIGNSRDPGAFPMLEMLVLKRMSELQSLTGPSCEGGALKEGTLLKLRVLKIVGCSALRKLPRGIEKLPNLIALYGPEGWWENMIWEDNDMKRCLDKIFIKKEI